MTIQEIKKKFTSKNPRYPHKVSLEIWPDQPVYQTVQDADQFENLMGHTLQIIVESLADYGPSIAITTADGSDRTEVVVTPPKEIIEEANAIN